MAIEGRQDTIIYKVLVPIAGAVAGALAATWFGAASIDNSQLLDVITLIKDPALSAAQKLQALNTYKEITDRPWAIVRQLTSVGTTMGIVLGMAFAMRIRNQ